MTSPSRPRQWWLTGAICTILFACGGTGGGCACGGFTQLPQGSFTGERLDTAGAARLSANGFGTLNANAPSILQFFAPGGQLVVPVPCSIQQVSIAGFPLLQLAIADTGDLYCSSETCGRMDGRCDARDLGHSITINISSLEFAPKSPDVLEATISATVQTGLLPLSTVSRSSALCLFNGAAKCTVDLDTARAMPANNQLAINIKLGIDTRWDKLLSLEVTDVPGAKACGSAGAQPLPRCLDPNDIVIANEGGCGACTTANFSVVKTLIVDQLASSLKEQINKALTKGTCLECAPGGACPSSGTASSTCDRAASDAGICMDSTTMKCVPMAFGTEGRLEIGQALAGLGAQPGTALDIAIAAGGGASANDAGVTVGLRGGAKEVVVADCVAPRSRPTPPVLPLPDFDRDAPGPYDVGVSFSQQFLTEAMFRAQQSGALCLELGNESVAVLESKTLSSFLGSLDKLTHGENVPLRVALRPVNPPTATLGLGTVDNMGKPLDPLVRLEWKGLQIDLYALLEERYVRLFTVDVDVSIPLGVTLDGCSGLTPVVGSLMGAVPRVDILNNELLAEPLDALKGLVPALLTVIEPQLAKGLTAFTIPELQGFQLKLLAARGVGQIAGTAQYNHLGLYAQLLPATQVCTPMMRAARRPFVSAVSWERETVELSAPVGKKISWRVNSGLWSTFQPVDSLGRFVVQHPRLMLNAVQVIDVRTEDGEQQQLVLEPTARP